jgi:protein-S-isoprenylcysteine O-methyltransferase Ste14
MPAAFLATHRMVIRSSTIERFLKSFALSLLLCLVWGCFTLLAARKLVGGFDDTETLWLVYNATISLLFLIRSTPSVVDMNPVHWAVALVTSFAGFAFAADDGASSAVLLPVAKGLIWLAIALGVWAAFLLGRSYDFLPALRHVRTDWLYCIVRHPMYTSSLAIKLGYVLKHPSIYNCLLVVVVALLYDRRAKYEEDVMSHDASYADYLRQVRYRFIPGVY